MVNDGVTIARAIELADPMENAGAALIREVTTILLSLSLSELNINILTLFLLMLKPYAFSECVYFLTTFTHFCQTKGCQQDK